MSKNPIEFEIKRKLVLWCLWWDRLWIRSKEDHPSFKYRGNWRRYLTNEEWSYYLRDLLNRRRIARIITHAEQKYERKTYGIKKK
jgi:hypothetical protein